MPKGNAPLYAFNRGILSRFALARTDVERPKLSAEEQTNFLPKLLGPMTLRPGLGYKWETKSDNAAEIIPFFFAADDTASVELTDSVMRVAVDDTLITRASVSTTVTNGDMSSSTGWTLSNSTISGGELNLVSPATGTTASAVRSVTVSGGDQNTEHAFRIIVTRGPIVFKCGTTSGGDDLISRAELDTGYHSLTFTPGTGTIYVYFETTNRYSAIVDSIQVESAGMMELPTPWGASDLANIRYTSSGDIIFISCRDVQQRKIERRGTRAWSIVLYKSNDGPFKTTPDIPNLTLTPSATVGNVSILASANIFKAEHVGSLILLNHTSQRVASSLAASNTFSDTIKITGVGTDRDYTVAITGTWVGTLTLQRSAIGSDTGFTDAGTYTINASQTLSDAFDNETIYYRLGFKAGQYTSGTANIVLTFPFGGGRGVGRITTYSSATSVGAEVYDAFGDIQGTTDWRLSEWSDDAGWPTANEFYDGRLWWFGLDREWASVSDDYYSFDTDVIGDSGPIIRSLGKGAIDTVNWALPLSRLIVGTPGAEISVRSSSFDEPLTPTNFSQKPCSTQGSAAVKALQIDKKGIYVQKSKRRLFVVQYGADSSDFNSSDLTSIVPDIAEDNIVKIAAQRQPDTRIHCVLGDGTAAVLLYETDQDVIAWYKVETDGLIENVFVLPGEVEDQVYYVVARTIGGNTKRFVERFAREEQCRGQPEGRLADSHIVYSGVATTTITGLSHLEGEEVIAWGWNTSSPFTVTLPDGSTQTVGRDLGTYTVSAGQITVSDAVTDACVGLVYEARFKSSKLAYFSGGGTALTQMKRVDHLGLILADTHTQALEVGTSFDIMDQMPMVEDGMTLDEDTIFAAYDGDMVEVPGNWETDQRLHLRATAPKPCTVMGAVVGMTTNG
jgi:hypothetical protein